MRLMFVSADDSSRTSSENNAYFIRTGLESAGVDVAPWHPPRFNPVEYAALGALKSAYRLRGRNFQAALSVPAAARRRRHLERAIAVARPDVILANSPAVVAGLPPSVPYVVFTDAPIQDLIDMGYYYDNWPTRSLRRFLELERQSLANAVVVIYHTHWAAAQAVDRGLVTPDRVRVVLPGANLWQVPPSSAEIDKPRGDRCELLFFGRDWERKGGPIALTTVESLVARGIPARLTIAGPSTLPADAQGNPHVNHLGRLGKDTDAERARLEAVFRSTDYVLMPTRAEASTSAIREAAAFGVPSIVTDIGGHRDVIIEGETGHVLPLDAGGHEYAEVIRRNFQDPGARLAYRSASRRQYEERLNWGASVKGIMSAICSVTGRERSQPLVTTQRATRESTGP